MSKIVVKDLSFVYTEFYHVIFEHVNLVLDTDWKLGLIGRNGRGKSTFLNLMHGMLKPESGGFEMDVETELFPYSLRDYYDPEPGMGIRCPDVLAVMKEAIGGLYSMECQMNEIIELNQTERFDEYQDMLTDYLELDGYNMEASIKKELQMLRLPEDILQREFETLSGGEKTKVQIAILFLKKNAFVLMDEPTNHLDMFGKQVLAEYLQKKKGFILVSHDRDFLDKIVDHVLSINKTDIQIEQGNYSTWRDNKEKKEHDEFHERTRLVKEINALKKVAENKRDWAEIAESTKNDHGKYERSSGSRSAQYMMHAKNAEEEAIRSLEEKEQLLLNYEVAPVLTIEQKLTEYPMIMKIDHLNYQIGDRKLIQNLTFSISTGDRIWVQGNNGTGKSTLLRILAGEIVPKDCEEDTIVMQENIRIAHVYQEPMWKIDFLKNLVTDEKAYQRVVEMAAFFDLTEDILKRPIETFSGGEKRKLDVARALAMENELILLDEPLNYMDVTFREQLEKAILTCNPTIVFVEHDRRFGENIATKVIRLG